jgi:hypothetical protein
MTRTEIILLVVGIGALVAILLSLSGGGPRVTQIDRTVRKEKDSDDA